MFKFCWHSWTNWSDPTDSGTYTPKQWARCIKCNAVKNKNIWFNAYTTARTINETLKNAQSHNK